MGVLVYVSIHGAQVKPSTRVITFFPVVCISLLQVYASNIGIRLTTKSGLLESRVSIQGIHKQYILVDVPRPPLHHSIASRHGSNLFYLLSFLFSFHSFFSLFSLFFRRRGEPILSFRVFFFQSGNRFTHFVPFTGFITRSSVCLAIRVQFLDRKKKRVYYGVYVY